MTERERDSRRVLPHVQALDEPQRQLFLAMLVSFAEMGRQRRDLDDQRLADALGALRKTVETRVHGVIYEHRPDDARTQALVRELAELIEGRPAADRRPSHSDTDQLAVLKALDATVAGLVAERADPRAFFEMVARLTAGAAPAAAAEASPIVLA